MDNTVINDPPCWQYMTSCFGRCALTVVLGALGYGQPGGSDSDRAALNPHRRFPAISDLTGDMRKLSPTLSGLPKFDAIYSGF